MCSVILWLICSLILRLICSGFVGASAEFWRLGLGSEGKCAFYIHVVGLAMAPKSRGKSHSRPSELEMSFVSYLSILLCVT